MNPETNIAWLDVGLTYSVLLLCMYYLFMRCADETDGGNESESAVMRRKEQRRRRRTWAIIFSFSFGFSLIWIRPFIFPAHLLLMLLFVILTNFLLYRNEQDGLSLHGILTLSVFCFAIVEAAFMLVGITHCLPFSLLYGKGSSSVEAFLNDKPLHIAAFLWMLFVTGLLVNLAARGKRLRGGLRRIAEHRAFNVGIIIAIALVAFITAFVSMRANPSTRLMSRILLVFVLAFCCVMLLWIKREISSDYVRECRKYNLTLIEQSLAKIDADIALIQDDNAHLAEHLRSDSGLIAELAQAIRTAPDAAKLAAIVGDLEELYRCRGAVTRLYEAEGSDLPKTGVQSVDAILLFMSSQAEACGVAFALRVEPGWRKATEEAFRHREMEILLADLTQNAMIAAKGGEAGAVAVKLRAEGESGCLEVLDSGAPFSTEVLQHMGSRRITTHADEGGSGIGMMTVFRILNHTAASLVIEEFPAPREGLYTKSLRVLFDGQRRLRLQTPRAGELRKALKGSRLEVAENPGEEERQ